MRKLYLDIEQRSEEWYAIRAGKLGASQATAIFAGGAGLDTAIINTLADKYSKPEESYTNADIDRGIFLEPQARQYYQINTGNIVEEVGYIEYSQAIGCSPDGLIGEDGGIEIKCVNNANFFKPSIGKPEKKYVDQCKMSIVVSGRQWWDLMYYNPNFDDPMLTWRIELTEEEKKEIEEKLKNAEDKLIKKENEYIKTRSI